MKRDDRVDALKGVLITLVVFGHCFLYGNPMDGVKWTIANWVYLFHMPFFVFLSGYFSHPRSHSYWKGILAIAESYIVFQLIKGLLHGYSIVEILIVPAPMMWYLLALIIWRCLYCLFDTQSHSRWHNWTILIVLFAVGLVAGFHPAIGKTFALSRIIVFAPFFWLGTMAQRIDFINFNKRVPKWIAGLLLVATLVMVAYLTPQNWLNVRETIRGASCYEADNQIVGLISRAVYYVLAIVLSISVTSLVISSKLLCQIGKDSLKYYLFHGIALSIMVFLKLPWNWYFAIVYGIIVMMFFYFFNKTTLSEFAIRPVFFILKRIKSNKQHRLRLREADMKQDVVLPQQSN